MSDKKTHGVPALLSFFIPGLGQLIKGHIFKAIGIWVALFISGMLVTFVIGLITTPLLWLWQIFDAYNN
ncbi:hypothetical protein [Methanolobus sp.]|uniref:hypothetical protein n=1 Tax=Methanolobus sp. TaxID=1874737 RepID=UPI0025F0848D|nr:hypothetical protein [Methanolobus sp.]